MSACAGDDKGEDSDHRHQEPGLLAASDASGRGEAVGDGDGGWGEAGEGGRECGAGGEVGEG